MLIIIISIKIKFCGKVFHTHLICKSITMQTNQILSASLLDLVFDGRNKDYGAYELRKKYTQRIKKSLMITGIVVFLGFGGATLANSLKKGVKKYRLGPEMTIASVDDKKPEKLPEPEKPKPVEPEVRTEKFTATIKMVEQPDVTMPPMDDIDSSLIGTKKTPGIVDPNIDPPEDKFPGDEKGIIQAKPQDDELYTGPIEVEARYTGDWKKFLEKNLGPNIPVDNNAPVGTYSVVIQFVVDKEGIVSDIKALTHHGYGMEEEAIRVIKKSAKWEPAFQNGVHVKAYRKQVITFQVLDE